MPMLRTPPDEHYDGGQFEEEEEEEDEEEVERTHRRKFDNFDISRNQRHVQSNNSKRKNVTFNEQKIDADERNDAEASNQLLTEHRQAGTSSNRVTRSRSPDKRNVSAVDSHRASEEYVHPAQRSTSRGPSSARSRRTESPFRYSGTADPTPPENLTPQERKDKELDADVMTALAGIRKRIAKLCNNVFYKDLLRRDYTESSLTTWVEKIEKNGESEFISYCRAIAEGGGDVMTWLEVIQDKECRFALSYGIIHRVLVQHVFGSLLFGAPEELLTKLKQLEEYQENEDGFCREEHRAEHITSYEIQYRLNINHCKDRQTAIVEMTLQICKLLHPLFQLDSRIRDKAQNEVQQDLIMIVGAAAELATLMRRSGKTVLYQFGKFYKDMVADRKAMEVLNFKQLKEEHDKSDGADQVLIRMVCGDSLVAYRKGGGVMAERILEKEEKEQDMSVAPELRHMPRNQYRGRLITTQDGYREKFLAKAQVLGRLEQIGSENKAKDLMDTIRVLRTGGCRQQ